MAEIKIDLINYCKVNMSSPNSCNSSSSLNNSSNKKIQLNEKLTATDIKTPLDQMDNGQLDKLKNKLNNDRPINISNHLISKQPNKSTTKFYVNKQLKNENSKIEQQQQTDEQNEIDDQFSEEFDKRAPRNSSTDSTNNYKSFFNNFVTNEDIGQLLKAFQEKSFKTNDIRAKDEKIQFMCLNLFNYDYKTDELIIINNNENELSSSYPTRIIIPKTKSFLKDIDTERLRNLIIKAKYARARCRFPVPVILFNNKYICRSATLSHCIEIYSRQSYASFFKTGEEEQIQDITTEINEINLDSLEGTSPGFDIVDPQLTKQQDIVNDKNGKSGKSNGYFSAFKNDYSHTVNEARAQDILLLNYLNVKHIIDLMVEMKKVKYGIYVASSEKADKLKRYSDFNINVLPYPGCEFFKFYRDNNYQAEGLVYDWDQAFIDADLNIPKSDLLDALNIDFSNKYKTWDLNNLTLNYLKLILSYMVQSTNESILLHCISSWDRTPLFVSLIRLSLWADYELHQNLNYEQMLYLTLAYDWYLFGHDLSDRVDKGEEIMHYCFYFLKFLSSTEHSIDYLKKNIVKKGNEYLRVRFNCCNQCKEEEKQNKIINKNSDELKLSVIDIDEEISSSMFSSQASTVVNNNLKKDQISNQFNSSDTDEEVNVGSDEDLSTTPKNINCFLTQQLKQSNSKEDIIDHSGLQLTNSAKTFVMDSNFDQNISASPSSFSAFKELRNNSSNSLNRNSLTIERDTVDLNNKFDVISLDDQSLSSNSSYDVLHAVNKHQQVNSTPVTQQSTPTNNQFNLTQNGLSTNSLSLNQQMNSALSSTLTNNHKFKQSPKQHQINNCNSELNCKDSFSCGSPPQLLSNVSSSNCCEIVDEDHRQCIGNKLIDDEDLLSSSGESNTLAEDIIDSSTLTNIKLNSNIQRSNAVAIPSRSNRNQESNKYNSSISSNDQLNWSNDYSSNHSNLSNTSNRLSDQSFNLNRCDSWQMVTATGSLRDKTFLSSTSLDEIKRNINLKIGNGSSATNSNYKFKQHDYYAHNYVPTCCCKSLNCGKYCEKVYKFNKENDLEKFIYTRKKRLSDVRVVFYQCYSKYIGLSTPNGVSGNEITSKFSSLINKTCEKIKYPFRTTYTSNLNGNFTRNGNARLSNGKSSFQSYIENDCLDLENDKIEKVTS